MNGKEHPVLFSLAMIKAKMQGIKTMTRRLPGPGNSYVDGLRVSPKGWKRYDFDFTTAYIDPGPSPAGNDGPYLKVHSRATGAVHRIYPLYQHGDLLYTRENWQLSGWDIDEGRCCITYADGTVIDMQMPAGDEWTEWIIKKISGLESNGYLTAKNNRDFVRTEKPYPSTPGIHLPKWGSRIWDRVTKTYPQPIQSITDEDAIREGVELLGNGEPFSNQAPRTRFNILWNNLHPGSWAKNDWVWVTEYKNISLCGKPLFKNINVIDA